MCMDVKGSREPTTLTLDQLLYFYMCRGLILDLSKKRRAIANPPPLIPAPQIYITTPLPPVLTPTASFSIFSFTPLLHHSKAQE